MPILNVRVSGEPSAEMSAKIAGLLFDRVARGAG